MLIAKLTKATKLIESLAGEKIRWKQDIEINKVNLSKIPGNCIISTAFLCYSGALSGKYRKQLIKRWIQCIKDAEIPNQLSDDFNVATYITDPA